MPQLMSVLYAIQSHLEANCTNTSIREGERRELFTEEKGRPKKAPKGKFPREKK
jgi:hypothetical protein